MRPVVVALGVFIAASGVFAQHQEAVFFRDGWNIKTYPAAPRLAQNAAMVPAVALSAAETTMPEAIDEIYRWNASGREPMRTGFKRSLPDAIELRINGAVAAKTTGIAAFGRGLLQTSDRGTIVWSTLVQVEKADRVRLHLENVKLPAGAVMWVYGASDSPRGFDSSLMDPNASIWAPSVHGPLVYLDVELPPNTQASFVVRELVQILGGVKPTDAPTCLIDASCTTSATFAKIAQAEAAIAHLEFVTSQGTAVCSGGLLTDRAQDGTPYLLTANHCLSDQTTAATLESYFDYRTNSCGGSPNVSTPVNGATLLATSPNSDFTFVQLPSRPAGRVLLGWDARADQVASSGVRLHRVSHPLPDPKQLPYPQQYSNTTVNISVGQCSSGTRVFARPRFIYSSAGQGGVYGGSSGSPVMLDNGAVVGQLFGSCGPSPSDGCDARNSTVDGAFATTYDSITNWLENGNVVTPTVCTANATTLCLSSNRFAVSAVWKKPDGTTGQAQAVALTGETGYFWWESASNVEMVLKVLNACVINQRIWVFAGGMTNINVVMTVIDTKTGTLKTYTNPQQIAFQPIQDTSAFATCP